MPEIKKPITAYKVYFYCNDCFIPGWAESKLINRNIIVDCDPPLYVHYCQFCDKEFNLKESYPIVEFAYPEEEK